MKVCLDVQAAIAQRAGIGEYTRELALHLDRLAEPDSLCLFYFDFKRKGCALETRRARHKAVHWCPGRAFPWLWKSLHWPPFDLLAGPADVYHFPNFIAPPVRRGKIVVTVHDMSFIRFGELAEERNRRFLSARIGDTLRRADAIIADCEFGANEIREIWNVDPGRLFAIPLGVAARFTPPDGGAVADVRSRFGLDRPYLLTVGTLEPRKNIPFLVEVFERLTDFDGQLVIAGMPGWKCKPILERIRSSPAAARIRYLQYVPEDCLAPLYGGAAAFVLTSLYEGFGLPPLEAMACGTPVISSTGGSLPEVLGDAAKLIPGFDTDQWVDGLAAVLADAEAQRRMTEQGRHRAARYSWSETARRTLDVYRMLAR